MQSQASGSLHHRSIIIIFLILERIIYVYFQIFQKQDLPEALDLEGCNALINSIIPPFSHPDSAVCSPGIIFFRFGSTASPSLCYETTE
jgi:hypothetical protein